MTDQKSSKQPKWLYIAAGIFALVSVVALVEGVLAVDNSPTTSSPEFAKSVLFFIFSVLSLLLSIVIFFVAKAGLAFIPKGNYEQPYKSQIGSQKFTPIHRDQDISKPKELLSSSTDTSSKKAGPENHDKPLFSKRTNNILVFFFLSSEIFLAISLFALFFVDPIKDPSLYEFWANSRDISFMVLFIVIGWISGTYYVARGEDPPPYSPN